MDLAKFDELADAVTSADTSIYRLSTALALRRSMIIQTKYVFKRTV